MNWAIPATQEVAQHFGRVAIRFPRTYPALFDEVDALRTFFRRRFACACKCRNDRRSFCASTIAARESLLRDWDRMVTCFRYRKDHWIHLRTTNIVESPFSS
jgi:hypothetical protein